MRLLFLGSDCSLIRIKITGDISEKSSIMHSLRLLRLLPITKLEQTNFKEYQKSLPVQALPKTYKDAMEIARKLGFSHIWIDSLCIIQDSIDDWCKESKSMSGVSQIRSELAATGAVDGYQV